MGRKTKKIKAAGKFGSGIGIRARKNYNKIEELQRIKQKCPYCSKFGVKREASGIWNCNKCGKKFAGNAYYLENKP